MSGQFSSYFTILMSAEPSSSLTSINIFFIIMLVLISLLCGYIVFLIVSKNVDGKIEELKNPIEEIQCSVKKLEQLMSHDRATDSGKSKDTVKSKESIKPEDKFGKRVEAREDTKSTNISSDTENSESSAVWNFQKSSSSGTEHNTYEQSGTPPLSHNNENEITRFDGEDERAAAEEILDDYNNKPNEFDDTHDVIKFGVINYNECREGRSTKKQFAETTSGELRGISSEKSSENLNGILMVVPRVFLQIDDTTYGYAGLKESFRIPNYTSGLTYYHYRITKPAYFKRDNYGEWEIIEKGEIRLI